MMGGVTLCGGSFALFLLLLCFLARKAQPALRHIRLQPPSHTVAASATYGCSLRRIRLQPPPHTVAASAAYGCSLRRIRLQPPSHRVAASRVAPWVVQRKQWRLNDNKAVR